MDEKTRKEVADELGLKPEHVELKNPETGEIFPAREEPVAKLNVKQLLLTLLAGVLLGVAGLTVKAYVESPHNHLSATAVHADCPSCSSALRGFVIKTFNEGLQQAREAGQKPKLPKQVPAGPPAPKEETENADTK